MNDDRDNPITKPEPADTGPQVDQREASPSGAQDDTQKDLQAGSRSTERIAQDDSSPPEPTLLRTNVPEPAESVTAPGESDPMHAGTTSAGFPAVPGYKIIDVIGRGGMGIVYRARQVSLDRVVALKMLAAGGHASEKLLNRFQIEAEAVARLTHPNIVQIFEVGATSGHPFFSLEYVEGGSLADRLDGTPLPPGEVAPLILQLAEAVEFAHTRGIVHRDLKPANILLDTDGAPKIGDFGLAKRLEDESGQTKTGEILGTPSYMAPEQAGGVTKQIGPACDVYALGVLLFEMLTGRPPFRGRDAVDTLMLVLSTEPVRPRDLHPQIPRDLETICLKCLEKAPSDRYGSAATLAGDLKRFLAGEPIHARPASLLERGRKWARRRPAWAALWAVCVLSAGILFGGAAYYTAQLRLALAESQAHLDDGLNLIDGLVLDVAVDGLGPLPNTEVLRRELLEGALQFAESFQSRNPSDPEVRSQAARAHRLVADIRQLLGDSDTAHGAYIESVDLLETLASDFPRDPEHRRELAAAQNNFANLLERRGSIAEARDRYDTAIAILEQLAGAFPDTPRYARQLAVTLGNRGVLLATSGAVESATEDHRRAIDLLESPAIRPQEPDEIQAELAGALVNMANAQMAAGEAPQAADALRRAIELLLALPADITARPEIRFATASARNNLGAALEGSDPAVAEAEFRRAIGQFDSLVAGFPGVARYQSGASDANRNLAARLAADGQHKEAQEILDRTIETLESLATRFPGEPLHPDGLAGALNQLGMLWEAAGESRMAEDALTRAVELREKLTSDFPEQPDYKSRLATVLHTTATMLEDRGKPGDAARFLSRAVEMQESASEISPQRADYRFELRRHYGSLATILVELGEAVRAARIAERLTAMIEAGAQDHLQAATVFATCIPLVTGVKGLGDNDADGDVLAEQYASRAVELLREAIASGAVDSATLADSDSLQALRDRPEFKSLLEQAESRKQ